MARKKMTEKQDKKTDKRMGIKEGSKRDMMMDKRMGVSERRGKK